MPPEGTRPHMPGYGVETPEWQPLPWSWAAERLVANRNYWVVTVSADGRPHALPVWGVWDDDERRFAFSCAPASRKARNLGENPAVVVTVDDTVECVSVEGYASVLDDGPRREQWIARYVAHYRDAAPELSADFLREHLVVEVVPERVFGMIEREDEFATRATRWDLAGEPG